MYRSEHILRLFYSHLCIWPRLSRSMLSSDATTYSTILLPKIWHVTPPLPFVIPTPHTHKGVVAACDCPNGVMRFTYWFPRLMSSCEAIRSATGNKSSTVTLNTRDSQQLDFKGSFTHWGKTKLPTFYRFNFQYTSFMLKAVYSSKTWKSTSV